MIKKKEDICPHGDQKKKKNLLKNQNPNAVLQSFCQTQLAGSQSEIKACERLSITLLTVFIYSNYCISQMCWWCIDWHVLFKNIVLAVILVAVDDDVLVLCIIRSWTGRERTTQTLSRPPTLDFAKSSRQTRRHTPLCSPEHSRTKPSTCTGSRRNARKTPKARQRPARLNSRSRNPPRQRPEERERERDGGGEEEIKALNPRCSSVSCLHCAQLWSCPLFY